MAPLAGDAGSSSGATGSGGASSGAVSSGGSSSGATSSSTSGSGGGSSSGGGSTSSGGSASGSSSGGFCQPDGVPCIDSSQCCTGQCSDGVCGGLVPLDAGGPTPPPSCPVSWTNNQCDVCLTASCCKMVFACSEDPACSKTLQCFDACYTGPGTGASCASQCNVQGSGVYGSQLVQCAVDSCVASCS